MISTLRRTTALALLAAALPASAQSAHFGEFAWPPARIAIEANTDSGVRVTARRDSAAAAAWFAPARVAEWCDSVTTALSGPAAGGSGGPWVKVVSSLQSARGNARLSVLRSGQGDSAAYRVGLDDGSMNDAVTADVSRIQLGQFAGTMREAAGVASRTAAAAPPKTYYEFQVTKPVLARNGTPAPAYPASMMETHSGGSIVVQFEVDTTGKAVMSTFKVISTTDSRLTDPVKRIVPFMKFYPAELDGRKVAQYVQMPFTFGVEH